MNQLAGSPSEEAAGPPPLTPAQIFLRFLRFGCLAWGGPVAQIGMLRRELVDEERWISSARFNRVLAVYQVLPGPEAHELCVYLGTLSGGRLGGLLAGLGFMLPGFVLMFVFSWLYFVVDLTAPGVGGAFLGVQVAVIALIARAAHRIGEHALLDRWLLGIAAGGAAVTLLGVSFWIPLLAGGCLYAFRARGRHGLAAAILVAAGLAAWLTLDPGTTASLPLAAGGAPPAVGAPQHASPWAVFLSGLRAGLLTFGGAYTAIPFLRDDAVGRAWMTDAQFLDGLAISGILPAPLIIFSTFVGYFGGGPLGALAMTAGIFLPAFSFGLFFHRPLEKVVESPALHALLVGVTAAVVGVIVATAWDLALVLAAGVPSLAWGGVIFAASLATLYLWKVRTNVFFVVLGAGVLGWLVFGVG